MRYSYIYLLMVTALYFCPVTAEEKAANVIEDPSTHQKFPFEIVVDEKGEKYELAATGVTTGYELFVKKYSVAHYLQKPVQASRKHLLEHIFDPNSAKELILQWVSDKTKEQFQKTLTDSFQLVLSPAKAKELQSYSDKLLTMFQGGINKGDVHIYRWLPGGILEVEVNGKVAGRIVDQNFAKAFWSIWLGDQSIVNRNKLLALAVEKPNEKPTVIINNGGVKK